MNIALIGYGKMGKAIGEVALDRSHLITLTIDADNLADLNPEKLKQCDVAIEFTGPASAPDNIIACLDVGIPVVSGSTGWLEKYEQIRNRCVEKDGSFIYASNYSIGVNIFFELNKKLAELMKRVEGYHVGLEEIHHTEKKDSPSGTAITLAEQIISSSDNINRWVNVPTDAEDELEIISKRIDPAPGTHVVRWGSEIDDIEIMHTAHNRKGFALGAVLAAEFLIGKKGIFTMSQVLGFQSNQP